MGRLTSVRDEKNLIGSRSYDAAGNLIRLTDATGKITAFSYDRRNRPITANHADGTTITNESGAVGEPNSGTQAQQAPAAGGGNAGTRGSRTDLPADEPLGGGCAPSDSPDNAWDGEALPTRFANHPLPEAASWIKALPIRLAG
jgi:YD repeat-containing protein